MVTQIPDAPVQQQIASLMQFVVQLQCAQLFDSLSETVSAFDKQLAALTALVQKKQTTLSDVQSANILGIAQNVVVELGRLE